MIRFGAIARAEYQSKHTSVFKACGLTVNDIPGDFENLEITLSLPNKTTGNDPITEIRDCTIVTLPAARNGSDPTSGIDDFNEIVSLQGTHVTKLSSLLGRPLNINDIGATFNFKLPVLSLGGTQIVAAAAY